MQNKARVERRVFYIFYISFFILILILSIELPSENLILGQGQVLDLNNGWLVEFEDSIYEGVSLPHSFDVPEGKEMNAKIPIPENFPSNFKLRLRSSMQDIKMYVDDNLVFKTNKPKHSKLEVPDASLWYIVELPTNIQNKTLSLTISSNEKAFSGKLNTIYAGAGDTLLYQTIFEKRAGLMMAAVIFVFGVFALILSLSIRNFLDNRMLYLGSFFILVSLWVFSETKLFQIFTGNRFIIGGISYMMLSLIPIPFILYLRDAVLTVNKKLCTGVSIFFSVNFLFNIAFQILGFASFLNSISFTNTMVLILLLYIIGQLIFETISLKNKQAKKFLMYISILVLSLLVEIYYFYMGAFEYTSTFTRIGILTFLVFIGRSTFQQLDELVLKEKEAEIMKRLAFTDILTGAYNRLAYERDLDNLINDDMSKFRLILMDINDLKLINDNFGHSEGDNMLKKFYQIIKEVFGLKAKVYRLGGDEFTVILKDVDDYKYTQIIKDLDNKLEVLSKDLGYNVQVAVGSDIFYNKDTLKIKDFLDHIDKLMYANKRFIKQS